MSCIKSKGGRAKLDSWLSVSVMEEKLQLDRVEELRSGKPWKKMLKSMKEKDDLLVIMVNKLKNGEITTKYYLDRIIEIQGVY